MNAPSMKTALARPWPAVVLGGLLAPLLVTPWLSCGGGETDMQTPDGGGGAEIDADIDAPDGSADATVDVDPGPNELPCDVRAALEDACLSCHSSPPTSEAPLALTSRFDFLQPSSVTGESVGQRSVARMKSASAPMPPVSEPPAADWHFAILEQWVADGMPAGDCGAIPSKPSQTTCASGTFWEDGDLGDEDMNPGLPCRACHQMQAPEHAYFFSGTVFPSFHEQDLCLSPPPAEAKVEILNEDGTVVLTLVPGAAGNFTSSAVVAGVPIPYRARLVANGLTRSMTTLQTSGDCNVCHTEQGEEDAPGRLVWPRAYGEEP